MLTELRLRDGTLGLTWPLLPGDRQQLAKAYGRLTPESKFHRFLTDVPHLSDAMLVRLVDGVHGVNHIALVLFVLDSRGVGVPAGVGLPHPLPDDPSAADVALTVGEEFRGRGVASSLLAELVAERPSGVERLRTTVAADNPAALAMLRPLGDVHVVDYADRYDVTVLLPFDSRSTPDLS